MGPSEREDLQELLSIPGWQRFVTYTLQEYTGNGYRYHMRRAIEEGDVTQVRVVEALAVAVERLLTWPQERLDALKQIGDEDEWNYDPQETESSSVQTNRRR